MSQKGMKLLESMRRSKSGWKRRDLDRLYSAFGFIISHGANHDIVKHPKYPDLRATLPWHNEIAKVYVDYAVKKVDQLLLKEQEYESQKES
jgi:hypothetical protein